MDGGPPTARQRRAERGAATSRGSRATAVTPAEERRPHLVFAVAGQSFALPLDVVDRIVPLEKLLQAPGGPAGLHGIILMPDGVVAVLDPAALFGRPATVPSADACVLVTGKVGGGDGPADGLLVDGVERVLELAPSEILAPPRAGGLFAASWIAGMARTEGGLVPILDLTSLLGGPEVRAAVRVAATAVEELWQRR